MNSLDNVFMLLWLIHQCFTFNLAQVSLFINVSEISHMQVITCTYVTRAAPILVHMFFSFGPMLAFLTALKTVLKKCVLKDAGVDISIFTAHSVCGASSSAAAMAGWGDD